MGIPWDGTDINAMGWGWDR